MLKAEQLHNNHQPVQNDIRLNYSRSLTLDLFVLRQLQCALILENHTISLWLQVYHFLVVLWLIGTTYFHKDRGLFWVAQITYGLCWLPAEVWDFSPRLVRHFVRGLGCSLEEACDRDPGPDCPHEPLSAPILAASWLTEVQEMKCYKWHIEGPRGTQMKFIRPVFTHSTVQASERYITVYINRMVFPDIITAGHNNLCQMQLPICWQGLIQCLQLLIYLHWLPVYLFSLWSTIYFFKSQYLEIICTFCTVWVIQCTMKFCLLNWVTTKGRSFSRMLPAYIMPFLGTLQSQHPKFSDIKQKPALYKI